MDHKEVKDLLDQYNQGNLISEDRSRLDSWYIYQSAKNADEMPAAEVQEMIGRLKAALPLEHAASSQTHKLWLRTVVAAAAALASITLGIWLYNASTMNGRHPEFSSRSPLANDIAPGKQGATLVLANGKSIRLSDAVNGKIANEAGIKIIKTGDGELIYDIQANTTQNPELTAEAGYNTLSTAKGETYQLRLPDGSKVWLNAASSLSYSPVLSKNGLRKVKLHGEAYFEVAKVMMKVQGTKHIEKRMPFIVESNRQQVEVLGTHFNINAYSDEKEVKTTLLEGSVRVTASSLQKNVNRNADKVTLLPDQQSVLSGSGELTVAQVDVQEAIAWKQGKFRFENANLETVLREMSRWYNVEIVYTNGVPERRFTGDIDRNLSAAEALSILQFTKVKFNIKGQQIIVTK